MKDNTPKKTLSVPEAGKRYFDLGRNASYEAARRGELPVIKIGSRLRVPIVALERMLAEAGTDKAGTAPLVSPQVLGAGYQHRSHTRPIATARPGEPYETIAARSQWS